MGAGVAQKAEGEALRLIGLMYDTALGAHDWADVLKQLAASIDAKSAILRMVDYTERQVGFFDSVGVDPAYRQAYSRYYMNIDIYRELFETAPIGAVVQSNQIPGYKKRHKTEYFNDYQKPQDMEHVCGSVLARTSNSTIHFGAHRGKHTKDFGQGDFDFLQAVLPHLMRAVQMRQQFAAVSCQQALAESALHQLRLGVLLTDARGRPLFVNRMAEHHIVTSNGALTLSLDGLKIKKPENALRLCRLVADVASTTAGKGLDAGGDMRIACGDGSFLQLCVVPLSRECLGSGSAAPSACAAIFITRPGSVHLPWRRVALCYGLTQAEAKLAAQLAGGGGLEEAAERLGISIHTTRTHLKAIFAKTGARRQSELVSMLLQDVLAFCSTMEGGV